LLVWGLIGVLLVAVAIEFQSRKSHQDVLTALLTKIKAVDLDSTQPEVTEAVVKDVVGNKKPTRAEAVTDAKMAAIGAKRLEVYSWFTLNPTSKREIWVLYGGKGKDSQDLATVIEVRTSENVEDSSEVASASAPPQGGDPTAGGPERPQAMPGFPGGITGGGRGMGPPGAGTGGGRRGRPGAAPASEPADNSDADKTDAKTTDSDKSNADKSSEDKTAEDQTETPEEKTDKSDTDQE
jgi:hypothetical protein